MKQTNLNDKQCVPCQGGTKALDEEQIAILLTELGSGWLCGAGGHLYKQYEFKNFINAMTFANKIADIAEREQHHPNLVIGWGVCGVEIWTHAVNGLTENDFILAAKIDTAHKEHGH